MAEDMDIFEGDSGDGIEFLDAYPDESATESDSLNTDLDDLDDDIEFLDAYPDESATESDSLNTDLNDLEVSPELLEPGPEFEIAEPDTLEMDMEDREANMEFLGPDPDVEMEELNALEMDLADLEDNANLLETDPEFEMEEPKLSDMDLEDPEESLGLMEPGPEFEIAEPDTLEMDMEDWEANMEFLGPDPDVEMEELSALEMDLADLEDNANLLEPDPEFEIKEPDSLDMDMGAPDTEWEALESTDDGAEDSEALQDEFASEGFLTEAEEDDAGFSRARRLNITDEIREREEQSTEVAMDNYRHNLQAYGVPEEQIEAFVEEEREKINAEYADLHAGIEHPRMYMEPTNWEEIAASLTEGLSDTKGENLAEEVEDVPDVGQIEEGISDLAIDSIYEWHFEEDLKEGFSDVDIEADSERLDTALECFDENTWEMMSLDDQKASIENLADYVSEVVGIKNPPSVEYYYDENPGEYGAYNASTNTLLINEYMLYNSEEAADTIAHELWHAHQRELADYPQCERDYLYRYNFDNYISSDVSGELYSDQLVEAEARAFARQFKDRLKENRIGRGR